ncbi:Di-copper centre-containing protein [Mollisia scopiformis]|uniref:Di-copper centre-containing protein n=1 Tax=Mollisia scopiformis TaxID=149040 RepID=A0A194X275_MOLSC|nr:Di-copper centre-containing protein [Mollisia scopiformis]KUJ14273.1 Di-copper centre-containing protein [Mollisia scopiformis]
MAICRFVSFAACISYVLGACSSIEVRKEWRSFTTDEQTAWIDAVKCMAELPHNSSLVATVGEFAAIAKITSNSSYYDDYTYVHSDLNPTIHFTGLFFPFHRYFVWSYTQALKNDCGYTGVAPYWNWTIDAANVKDSTIWSDDASSGLGQPVGIASNDFVVGTGGFSSNFTLAYPTTHGLRRNFTLVPYSADAGSSFFPDPDIDANATFTPAKINALIANYTGDFKGFQKYMEGFEGPHGSVHEILGGDLAGYCPEDANEACFDDEPSPTFSANEPMFWMHHAMVDRVWWLWQNHHPNNTYAFEGGSVQNFTDYDQFPNGGPPWLSMDSILPTDGILMPAETTLEDIWITEGDLLCYTYDDA